MQGTIGVEPAEAIAAAARALLDGLGSAKPFLEAWPALEATRQRDPQGLPVLTYLETAGSFSTPDTTPLVEALVAAAHLLCWQQSYASADFGPAFLRRYGWTELIGLRGPIPSETIACGILLLGPQVDYPAHAHEAEELYVPLSGSALWTKGREPETNHRPGTTIHHPSWIPHAMRTGAEPLIALYVWRGGDLAAKSRIVDPSHPLIGGPSAS